MNNTFIDTFFKWFFILSSAFYLYVTVHLFLDNQPYFESLMSFLIEIVAAFYFIKKNNPLWAKENTFFILTTMTGFMITKTFYFFYHDLPYEIYTLMSLAMVSFCYISFKKYVSED